MRKTIAPIAASEPPSTGKIPEGWENSRILRFLVADDNGVNRRVAAIQLEHHGHAVETTTDGEEAVAMVARGTFDCVLMDVHMPGTDGLEATRRIRERERETGGHVAILAMTADSLDADRDRCRTAGMDDSVTKPLDPIVAIATARRVLTAIEAAPEAGVAPIETPIVPVSMHVTRRGRMTEDELRRLHEVVISAPGVREVLDRIPQPALLIGPYRQIVYANPAASQLMPATALDQIIGHRPGEALGCKHSTETAGGCGTTRFCVTCGTAKVLRAGQRGEFASDECRIAATTAGDDRDLRVWSAPLAIGGEQFTLFTLIDISDEKRREALERIFLHDVLNTAGGIQGLAALCEQATAAERLSMSVTVTQLAGALIDELHAQQALSAAEHGELQPCLNVLSSLELLADTADRFRSHDVARERSILVARGAADVAFINDATLLRRVIGNMTKNALEACAPGGVVTLNCRADEAHVEFSVHNPNVIPRDVQLQVFQRSFSTKGAGRGLGTYSMRLLTERYLGGTVSFSSSPEHGTTFIARYSITGPARPRPEEPLS